TLAAFRVAAARLPDDFAPIDDWRASAVYRMRVAQNLFERLYRDGAGEVAAIEGARGHG
ncbi:MAG: xanthine dehydrogenase small subunit, partial [Methylobacteriaceae bacterium]|nr:xanthine dehydrogenase small subunit [Methylobacteriaceae bacterium]